MKGPTDELLTPYTGERSSQKRNLFFERYEGPYNYRRPVNSYGSTRRNLGIVLTRFFQDLGE